MKNIFDLVGGTFQVEYLCKYLCDKYKLGKYVSYELIYSCDDNFNFVLISIKGKFFVKIFNIKYNDRFSKEYIERYETILHNPWVKMLLDNDGSKITKIKIDDTRRFNICVMEYVEGIELRTVKKEDVYSVLNFLIDIHKQTCNIEIRRNEASFIELKDNYDEFKRLLSKEEKVEVLEIIGAMNNIKYRNLKKTFIHNSLIAEDVLKENDKIYFVSFGYSGYGYRLLDLISAMNSVIYDGKNLSKIEEYWDAFLTGYKNVNPFNVEEVKHFDLLFRADCYSKLMIYKNNYKNKKIKEFKTPYKNMKKLLKFLKGKEMKV